MGYFALLAIIVFISIWINGYQFINNRNLKKEIEQLRKEINKNEF